MINGPGQSSAQNVAADDAEAQLVYALGLEATKPSEKEISTLLKDLRERAPFLEEANEDVVTSKSSQQEDKDERKEGKASDASTSCYTTATGTVQED